MRDEPLENFQKFVEECTDNENIQEELLDLAENLYNDLQLSKSTVSSLQNQIENLLKPDSFGLTSQLVALKEDRAVLNNKLRDLQDENDNLNTELLAKDAKTRTLLHEKEAEIRAFYLNQIKQKDEEVKKKEEEFRIGNENQKKQLQELQTKMEASAAYFALQMDQIESDYRKQIDDLNSKLKDCTHTCNVLRTELFGAKEKCNDYKKRMAELQKVARNFGEFQNSELLNSTTNSSIYEGLVKEKSIPNNKYQPLEINYNISPSPSVTSDKVYKRPPVYRSGGRFWGESSKNYNKSNFNLPPLMKLSTEKPNGGETLPKKRKLYNPNDLSYLNSEAEDDGISS